MASRTTQDLPLYAHMQETVHVCQKSLVWLRNVPSQEIRLNELHPNFLKQQRTCEQLRPLKVIQLILAAMIWYCPRECFGNLYLWPDSCPETNLEYDTRSQRPLSQLFDVLLTLLVQLITFFIPFLKVDTTYQLETRLY